MLWTEHSGTGIVVVVVDDVVVVGDVAVVVCTVVVLVVTSGANVPAVVAEVSLDAVWHPAAMTAAAPKSTIDRKACIDRRCYGPRGSRSRFPPNVRDAAVSPLGYP